MSANKKIVEAHMGASDHAKAAEFLADDIEWIEWADGVPAGGARTLGKTAVVQSFGDDVLHTRIGRMIEEGNQVVVEGTVDVTKPDGRKFEVQFCNLYELANGKIKRKTSYAALLKGPP